MYHTGAGEWSVSGEGRSLRGIVVTAHVGAKPAKMREVVVAPTLSSRVDFGAHNNDLPNNIRALNERVFNVTQGKVLVPTPQPEPGAWRSLGGSAQRLADDVCKFGKVYHLTGQEFLDQCPANKRKLYATAMQEYETLGWTRRHALIKAFVKFEKLNFTKKRDPAPRVIQPRSPVFNYALGRFTRRIEADMYRALAQEWRDEHWGPLQEEAEPVVMKGMTVEEVATALKSKWDKFKCPVVIGLDASRFDQHVSVDALKWEHSVYKKIYGYDPELMALLKVQLANEGRTYVDGHKIAYTVNGTRASGDMNTSLGNCMIMCTLIREYVKELGIHAELANNGDDCLLFIEKSDLYKITTLVGEKWEAPALEQWFLRYGFEMEVEPPVFEFEECVFCQSQPILVDAALDRWVMCRQPTSAWGKDALSLTEATELGFRQWSYQVGVGGWALFGDMPIFGALYQCYKRNGVDSKVKNSLIVSDSGFMRMCDKGPRVRGDHHVRISDDTRLSFFKAFGYPPSVQIAMEAELAVASYCGINDYPENIAVGWGLTTI